MLKKLKYFFYCSLIGITLLLAKTSHAMEPYIILEYKDGLNIRSITVEAYCTRDDYPDHFAICNLSLPIREVALSTNNGKRVTITTQDVHNALDEMEEEFTDPTIMNNAFINQKIPQFPFGVNEDNILFVKVKAYNSVDAEGECTIAMYKSNSYQRINLYFETLNRSNILTFNKLN